MVLVACSKGFGQENTLAGFQNSYLKARDHYNAARYSEALEAFIPLTISDNPFQEYASFFYAMSACNSGDRQLSKDMFLQIKKRFPNWEKMEDVNLWLAKLNFENKDYFQGMYYLGVLNSEPARKNGDNMKGHYFRLESDAVILENLLESFPEERSIAGTLAERISKKPLSEIDFNKLDSLVQKYNLDPAKYKLIDGEKVIKKDEYNIGVLLPFMFDELQPQRGRWSNQFILDIYEGMMYGKKELDKLGIRVNLFAFDTRRDSTVTASLVAGGQLDVMDVLVGPLYTGPSKVIADYSFQKRKNIINPLSANSEITGNNPYSFLYQSSSQSLAKAAADYVHGKFDNKNAAIFYGDSPQDEILANEYRKLIVEDSFTVVIFQKVSRNETRIIFETLMSTYQVPDSLDIDEERETLDVLFLKPDSIGHVFAASDDLLFGSTMISTIENRGDAIQLIGSEEWLQSRSVDYNVVEKLGVWFLSPNYFPTQNEKYQKFREDYLNKNFELPTKNILIGYNLSLFLGMNMFKYGKYFQIGASEHEFEGGYLRTGFEIGPWNDNAWIPIITMRSGEQIWLNKEQMPALSEQKSGGK
jgi:hypothetical protein